MMLKKKMIFFAIFWCFFLVSSCNEYNNTQKRLITMDCLYDNLDKMTNILDTISVGTEDGTFPLENANNLQLALENIRLGISNGLADNFVLQYEADNYCISAEKSITELLNSYQETLIPGTAAELVVFGIDGKGRIEFGANPAYGGGDAFTIESWIKYDAGFFESGIGTFISTFDGSTQPREGWMINFLGDNLRSTIGMGPQNSRVLEFGSKYPENYAVWNHLAMVYDSSLSEGQLKMYLNGELLFAKTNDIFDTNGVIQSYQPNTKNYNMWAFQEPTDLGRTMTGYIKKFRFWNTSKSADDINILMNSDVSGSESDLECAWDFTQVPQNDENIVDKTGKHMAKIVGNYKWEAL